MTDIIKTCPDCGGTAFLNSNYSYKTRGYFVFVKCEVCGAHGKVTTCPTDPAADEWNNDACNRSVEAWNLRKGGEDET